MYDIIIRGGTLVDGTGGRMHEQDIAIKDGKIVEIGRIYDEAREIIDAKGMCVTPGFIDVTNHSDTYWQLLLNKNLESLLYQGITTIIGGNCGSSLAPLINFNAVRSIQKWADISRVQMNWSTLEEFLDTIESREIALNFGTLVGHGTLRRTFAGDEIRNLTSFEQEKSIDLLEESLEEGAFGLSTGLAYSHAKPASQKEIAGLVKKIQEFNGVYTTHIRNETEGFLTSIEEFLSMTRSTKTKAHISHLKVMGKSNWQLFTKGIAMLESASKEGVDVSFDVFPYTMTGSVLYTLLPDWITKDGKLVLLKKLRDLQIRDRLTRELRDGIFDLSQMRVAISAFDKSLHRKSITDIAREQHKEPEEVLIDILLASEGRVIVNLDVLDENNIIEALKHPYSIIASDGVGYNIDHVKTGEEVHMRNFGAFPRVLARYVREQKILRLEEAIHKMTGKPAQRFGIERRGFLKEGYFGDIVVFDADAITDRATATQPYQYAKGIQWSFINGQVVIRNGVCDTSISHGEILRKR